jgi:lipoic acid synthetase
MTPKPPWLRKTAYQTAAGRRVDRLLSAQRLRTVCREARCPNRAECFDRGAATFLILGGVCTRACAFCGVRKGSPALPDPREPARAAEAAAALNLRHVVVTSVTRDDLPDGGAAHFAATVREIRRRLPGATIEILAPDFNGSAWALETCLAAGPHVFNHNVETVPRLYGVRPGASFLRSLAVLGRARALCPGMGVKSGLMVGLGETDGEVLRVIERLRESGCDMLTVGQYLAPSRRHAPVRRFVAPQTFDAYRAFALGLGFARAFAGPFVRSSYMADRVLPENIGHMSLSPQGESHDRPVHCAAF